MFKPGKSVGVSVSGRRIEFRDQAVEDGFEVGVVVVIRVGVDELDDFALAICRLFILAACFVHLTEAIVSVMHLGVVHE